LDFQEIEQTFENNIKDINKLMTFDQVILDISIRGLEELRGKLTKLYNIENPQLLAENTLSMLRSVRENKSLKPKYQIIFNQSIVLLVSVFASSISDLFKVGICKLAVKGDSKALSSDELKLSVIKLLEYDGDIFERIGDLIVEKNNISFQDMKSIKRAFKQYFEFTIEQSNEVNNIIMAQAARHVIVHDSARINDRIINQVSGAKPRELKPKLSGDFIIFEPEEVNLVAQSMLNYIKGVRSQIELRLDK